MRRDTFRLTPATILATLAAMVSLASPAAAQKTDVLTLLNGDGVTGEIKGFSDGQVKFSTDAMGTVYVRWPKITTVKSDKTFEIELADGTIVFGSLEPVPEDTDETAIVTERDTMRVATQSIVALARIKPTFWQQLAGSLSVGFDFTEQSSKTDLDVSANINYQSGLNSYKLYVDTSYSRQDDTDNITSQYYSLSYQRQFQTRWFYTGITNWQESSQLSLDSRWTLGGGLGRKLIQSNRLNWYVLGGAAYGLEQYTGQDPDNAWPLFFGTNVEYFTWGALDASFNTEAVVGPFLDDFGRWRVKLVSSMQKELINNFNLNISANEFFDSDPGSPTANRNDFSVTTSVSYSF